jgi:hypothetical protein
MNPVALRPVGKFGAAALVCVVALTLAGVSRAGAADPPTAQRDGRDNRDQRDNRTVLGPVLGALTVLVPLAIGGSLWAHDGSPDLQRAGTYVMLAGFTITPWVAHGNIDRWGRALGFGLTTLALSAGTALETRVRDPFDPSIANHDRLPFTLLLTTAMFVAVGSLVDSVIVGPAPR